MQERHGIKNLKPFKPGPDPRRHVKQRGDVSITSILKRLSKKRVIHIDEIEGRTRRMTVAEKMAIKLLSEAYGGNIVAIKEVNDRIEGKVTQPIDAGPMITNTVNVVQASIEGMKEDDLRALITGIHARRSQAACAVPCSTSEAPAP